jgi:SAM-dependent methyltransferase
LASLIAILNRTFPKPRVEGRESAHAYAAWERRVGEGLVRDYLEPHRDLRNKAVLDVGCGLGGKSVAYAEAGARVVVGCDLSLDNVSAAQTYAESIERNGRGMDGTPMDRPVWAFVAADASRLPVPDGRFDTVIANDAMEHFAAPEVALAEMTRVTRRGGVIWLFFTPHFSPLGSHLYDYIYIPWCHLLFSRRRLEEAIREVLHSRSPNAREEETEDRVRRIMASFDHDLNRMSIRRFFRLVRAVPGVRVSFRELRPAKYRLLDVATRIPWVRELFTGTVVCRLERF